MSYTSKNWLEKHYVVDRLSTTQIGKLCDISARTVSYWLKKHGIRPRTKSEALAGKNNPMYGKPVSWETRKKLSDLGKGRKHTDETKEKISQRFIGQPKSETHKKKLSQSAKERFANKNNHPKFGKPNKWGKHTEEAKKKISKRMTGEKNPMYGKNGKSNPMYGRRGKEHPAWIEPSKRKTTLYTQIRTSELGIGWKIAIFKRDNHTCVICNNKQTSKVKLNADHVKPLALIVYENKIKSLIQAKTCQELWNTNNGRTLCVECHKKTDTYGKSLKQMIELFDTSFN